MVMDSRHRAMLLDEQVGRSYPRIKGQLSVVKDKAQLAKKLNAMTKNAAAYFLQVTKTWDQVSLFAFVDLMVSWLHRD